MQYATCMLMQHVCAPARINASVMSIFKYCNIIKNENPNNLNDQCTSKYGVHAKEPSYANLVAKIK